MLPTIRKQMIPAKDPKQSFFVNQFEESWKTINQWRGQLNICQCTNFQFDKPFWEEEERPAGIFLRREAALLNISDTHVIFVDKCCQYCKIAKVLMGGSPKQGELLHIMYKYIHTYIHTSSMCCVALQSQCRPTHATTR